MNEFADVRPSPIAGTWYSGDASRLKEQVDQYLAEARLPDLPGEVIAVIAPHAGLRYSGRTAGHAFAAVRGQKYDLAAVISPMHAPYPADLLTTAHRAYGTPLGAVCVDGAALAELRQLLAQDHLELPALANDKEHSLEIELPFLQRAVQEDFQLLPVMVRSQSMLVARQLGHALAQVMKGHSGLLVASTDLSHFYPEPVAQQLDEEMLRRIEHFSPDELFEAERLGIGYACGASAAAAVLWAAQELGANQVKIVHHSTSGEGSGDFDSVVGYGAAVVIKHA
jgi:AmmeMemoRadiSam system protein B